MGPERLLLHNEIRTRQICNLFQRKPLSQCETSSQRPVKLFMSSPRLRKAHTGTRLITPDCFYLVSHQHGIGWKLLPRQCKALRVICEFACLGLVDWVGLMKTILTHCHTAQRVLKRKDNFSAVSEGLILSYGRSINFNCWVEAAHPWDLWNTGQFSAMKLYSLSMTLQLLALEFSLQDILEDPADANEAF